MTRFSDGSSLEVETESKQNNVAHLLEINFYDSGTDTVDTTYITTASQPLTTSGLSGVPDQTWEAIGLPSGDTNLSIQPIQETSDLRAQSVELRLDGVDQTFLSLLGNKFFRGRPIKIWRVWLSSGDIDDHLLIWDGLQNDPYEVEENQESDIESVGGAGTSTIRTQIVSSLARLQETKAVITNENSHNNMLKRKGLSTGDTGMQNTPLIQDKKIFWGREGPKDTGGSGSGSSTGGGSQEDDAAGGPNDDRFRR